MPQFPCNKLQNFSYMISKVPANAKIHWIILKIGGWVCIHWYLAFGSGLPAKKYLFSWQLVMKGQRFLTFFSPNLLIFIQAWLFFCGQNCGLWICTPFFKLHFIGFLVYSDNLYWNIQEGQLIVQVSSLELF